MLSHGSFASSPCVVLQRAVENAGQRFFTRYELEASANSANAEPCKDGQSENLPQQSGQAGAEQSEEGSLRAVLLDENYYEVLGLGDVGVDATAAQIKKKCR